ncbi:MAG: signal peptide peptidase SppA [Helicobacter sp.]|nr:signal peptide peptidase SppA [Helicobacter sp.]
MDRFYRILIAPFTFINNYFKSFIFLFIVILAWYFLHTPKEDYEEPNLARIELTGPIVSSDEMYKKVKKILSQKSIKGVLLIINSPGGLVAPSIEISDLIKELNEQIPVVAYVSGLMASGSYYGGMHANTIVANRGSMIGSIGVIFSSVNIEELMQKIGIKNQIITAGEYKQIGTPLRQWKDNEKKFLENLIKDQYDMFVNDVAAARHLDVKKYKDFAEGKVFIAEKALKLGLIDAIGNLDSSKQKLFQLTGVKDPIWYVPYTPSVLEEFINKLSTNISSQILNALTGLTARI